MTNSPWAKTVSVTPVKPNGQAGQSGSHRGRIALWGLGIGGRGPGGAGRHGREEGATAASADQPATLILRWESALPIREAELKARDTGAPDVGDDYYAIAVYEIPRGVVTEDSKERADELKNQVVLKRDGKRDLRPIRVDILLRESGPVVVYLFSKSAEFTWRDHGILFEGQISG